MTAPLGALVAPHVGAWIETLPSIFKERSIRSLPMWERGLKRLLLLLLLLIRTSLPMWERGLKHGRMVPYNNLHPVAPHVGAWIETGILLCGGDALTGRSPCGSVD